MTVLKNSVYHKLEVIADQVKNQLKRKGVAIPIRNHDGTITLGNYTIVKDHGFYVILDYSNEVVVDKINLPQSAAIIANSLAVGRFIDNDTLSLDRKYGFCEFEEQLCYKLGERNIKKNVDRADVMFTKSRIHKDKKDILKRDIFNRFEKLRKFA